MRSPPVPRIPHTTINTWLARLSAARRAAPAPRRSLLVLPLVLLGATALVHAGDDDFLYSLTQRGRISIKVTPVDDLPDANTLLRFTDLATFGGDRYALRVDGSVFRNTGFWFRQDNTPPVPQTNEDAWIRMEHLADTIFALSAGGRLTQQGDTIALLPTIDAEPTGNIPATDTTPEPTVPATDTTPEPTIPASTPPALQNGLPQLPILFSDLVVTPFGVFVLRLDGALFAVTTLDGDFAQGFRLGNFDAGPGVAGAPDGTTDDTVWVRLGITADDELLALRADGKLVRVDPFALPIALPDDTDVPDIGLPDTGLPDIVLDDIGLDGVGEVVATLPATPLTTITRANIYVDLEIDEDGSWYVMRRDGAVFDPWNTMTPLLSQGGSTALFFGNPFTTPLDGPNNLGNPYVDMLLGNDDLLGGTLIWRLRAQGQIFADETFIDRLLTFDFVRLSSDDVEPDLTGVPNRRPFLAIYKTRATEGEDVSIPIIATDLNVPADEVDLTFDFTKLPGATYDAKTGRVDWPGGMPVGSYSFRVWADDGGPQKPVRKRYRVQVLAANDDPDKTLRPTPSKISTVRALVDHELVLPILVTDRNGLPVQVADDGKGIFEQGATFDPVTNTLTWTPQCLDFGRRHAGFVMTNGTRTNKLKVKIEVLFPLFWEDDEE